MIKIIQSYIEKKDLNITQIARYLGEIIEGLACSSFVPKNKDFFMQSIKIFNENADLDIEVYLSQAHEKNVEEFFFLLCDYCSFTSNKRPYYLYPNILRCYK